MPVASLSSVADPGQVQQPDGQDRAWGGTTSGPGSVSWLSPAAAPCTGGVANACPGLGLTFS